MTTIYTGPPMSTNLSDAAAALVSERSFYLTVLPEIQTFKREWEASKKPKFGYSAPPWQKLHKFLVTHPHMRTIRGLHGVRSGTEASQQLCCMVVDHYFEEVWGYCGTLRSLISAHRNKTFEATSPWNEVCDVEAEVSAHLRNVKALVADVEELIRVGETPIIVQPPKEKDMVTQNNVPTIETRTFLNNNDVSTLTDDQLISWIKALENDVDALNAVRTKSKKITDKIVKTTAAIDEITKILDARP